MSDIEITKNCAEAIGWEHFREGAIGFFFVWNGDAESAAMNYNPLHDDAQAMALVKKLEIRLTIMGLHTDKKWSAEINNNVFGISKDLNRAICECVAGLK